MKKAITKYTLGSLLVGLCMLASSAYASIEAGKVLFARGQVTIYNDGETSRSAKRHSRIYEGDRIETGRYGMVQLHLSDGSLMSLRSNSTYVLEKQRYNTDEPELMEQAGELVSGWMRMVTGAIGKANPDAVKQRSVVATIGIRGTVFQVIHIPEGGLPAYPDRTPGTYLFLEEGNVEISGDKGTRFVTPGQVIFVSPEGGKPKLKPSDVTMFDIAAAKNGKPAEKQQKKEEAPNKVAALQKSKVVKKASVKRRVEITSNIAQDQLQNLVTTLQNERNFEAAIAIAHDGSEFFTTSAGEPDGLIEFRNGGFVKSRGSADCPGATCKAFIADNGAAPKDTGFHVLGDGTRIDWGIWDRLDYQYMSSGSAVDPRFNDAHYVVSTNVFDDPVAAINRATNGTIALPPTGAFQYDLAGGTPFTTDDPMNAPALSLLSSSNIVVDFDDASIQATLNMNIGNFTSSVDTIQNFYDNGLSMSNAGDQALIRGGIVGTELDAIVSTIHVNRYVSPDTFNYVSTAVFGKSGAGSNLGAVGVP